MTTSATAQPISSLPLNVASGEVVTHCHKGHTAVDVLEFFKRIDASVPRALSIHVVLNNLSAHKAPEITKWLAHPRRKRWHLHFAPTSSDRVVGDSPEPGPQALRNGTNPRPRSSRRCAVAVPPSTRSNQRRTTSSAAVRPIVRSGALAFM